MLTDREEKLIVRYCRRPRIAITAVIMALVLGVPFILLEMLDDIVFYHEGFTPFGLYVYLAFVVVYLFLFCFCTLSTRFGMRKAEWAELACRRTVSQRQSDYSGAAAGSLAMGAAGRMMQKSSRKGVRTAGTAAEVAGAIGAVTTAGAMLAELAANAEAMAEAYHVPVPDTKKLRLALILIPLVVLIGVYIPQYVEANEVKQQNAALVAERIGNISAALDPVCEAIYADDPTERYQSYGYRVSGYLRGMLTDDERCYAYVSLTKTGEIESVSYDEEIDLSLSPEENLSRVEKDFETLSRALRKTTAPAESSELLTACQLSQEFREAFLSGTYYDEIYLSETVGALRIICSFQTDPEEEFDEYTRPYIYLYVLCD